MSISIEQTAWLVWDTNINAVMDRQIHTEAVVADLASAMASATPKDSGAIQAWFVHSKLSWML